MVVVDNCEFEAVEQAALYCHDWETSDSGADKSGQKLTLLNCTLKNNDATHATIMLQSQELATNCATCKFDGCAVYNKNANGKKISMTRWQGRTLTNTSFMGSSDWVLDSGSSLNTEPLINATKDYVVEQYIFSVSGGIPSGAAGRRAADHPADSDAALRFVRYIQDHSTDVTLTSLADAFHYSPEHASRTIRHTTGQTFSQLLTSIRLENAKQLLRDTSMNVLDIALQVGYEGSDQFIRAFRKHNQTTPSEYRRRYQVDRS